MKAALAVALVSSTAFADAPRVAPTEIEIDRGDAPTGRTELGFDGGAPVVGWGATVAGSWLESPISFGLPDGDTSEPVRRRQSLILGGALALGDSVVFDARWAGSRQLGARLRGTGDERTLDRYVPGDLRIGVRLRVMTRPMFAMFVRGELALPTGDQQDFAGDPGVSVAWRLIARATLGPITLAASAGLRLRGQEVLIGDRSLGNESLAAAGIVFALPAVRPLWCTDQVMLTADASGVLGDNVGVAKGPSPVEIRAGVISRPRPAWTIGVRIGRGVTDQIGSPTLRATVELTYQGSWKLLEMAPATDEAESTAVPSTDEE